MESEFQVGDKVQIQPGTGYSRWGWTSTMARWAREGKVLKILEIGCEGWVSVEANDTIQWIEPESLRRVNWSAIDSTLVLGDKVRIKSDYSSFLLSSIAEQEWKSDGTVLTFEHFIEEGEGSVALVEGTSGPLRGRIHQAVPADSIERVSTESDGAIETPARKTEVLVNLEQGAIFSDNGDLCMKTDEIEEDTGSTTYYRCVVLTGEHTGLIVYLSGDKAVALDPNAAVVPALDPWEQAKVYYGDLQPGDLFRRTRRDHPILVCVVVNKVDSLGNYLSMIDSAVTDDIGPEQIVYRDSILIENDA